MRLLMFVGLTIGGAIGWWVGSHVGLFTSLILSSIGSLGGIYLAYRLVREYL